MDRLLVQPGAVPLETDLLNVQRSTMLAIGWFMDMVMGRSTAVAGLPCTPTSPPSMAVQIGQGMLCQGSTIDSTQFSTLPLGTDNTSPLVKAGILANYDPTSMLFNLAAPTQSGQSINYLIEASLLEVDDTPLVLPYYNSANPLQAFLGPGGNGSSVFTRRAQKVQLQLKAGVPAVDGFQVTPSADAGWVPLWIITTKFGDTSINSSRIVQHPAAPFIVNKLPQLQPLLGGRIRRVLQTTLNIYVSPTGSDSNDGQTSATPFQTLQQCWNYIQSTLDLNNQAVVINLANGSYTAGLSASGQPVGVSASGVSLVGNVANPAAVSITVANGPCIQSASGASLSVTGVSLSTTGSGVTANCIYANLGGQITIGKVIFGSCANFHVFANGGGQITTSSGYTISGSAVGHIQSNFVSVVSIVGQTITLSGTPAFSTAFAVAALDASISIYGNTFTGAATGARYSITSNATIATNGAGATYLPGSLSGSATTGAQYV